MNSTVEKFNKAGDKFVNHKSSMIIFVSIIVGAGIINIILFSFGYIGVRSPFMVGEGPSGIMVDSTFAWIAWISLAASLIGPSCSVWAFVLIIRKDTKFITPMIIGAIFSIPNEFFLGAIFSAICFTMLLFIEIWVYFQWKKDDASGVDNIKPNYLIIFILWLEFVVICFALIFSVDFFTQGGENYLLPVLDATTASVVLVCWTMALMKNKWGLVGMGITDISYIAIYIIQGSLALSMVFFVYIFMDTIAFFGWSNIKINK